MSIIKGFVTNLGKYNEGELIGEWVDFPCDVDDWEEVLERIGIDEEYEEYFFTDWEIDLGYCNCEGLGKFVDIDEVNEIAELVESLDSYDIDKLDAIMEVYSSDLEEVLRTLDNYEYYDGYTLEEYAQELIESCYLTKDTPDIFERYFDYEAFARDLEYDGYHETSCGVLWECC